MFKVSDKTRRQAYLNALSQTQEQERKAVNIDSAQQKPIAKVEKNNGRHSLSIKRIGRKNVSSLGSERDVLSGKDAIMAASKDIKVLGRMDNKKAIINNHIADMKYYDNWRARLNYIVAEEKMAVNESPNKNTPVDIVKPSAGFDEMDYERGKEDMQIGRKETPSKSLLDELFPADTKLDNDNDDDFSFLDDLFKDIEPTKLPERKTEIKEEKQSQFDRSSNVNKRVGQVKSINRTAQASNIDEDYSISDFEDDVRGSSFDDISTNATKVKTSKEGDLVRPARKIKKKKRKIDADIIGTTGFFTIR